MRHEDADGLSLARRLPLDATTQVHPRGYNSCGSRTQARLRLMRHEDATGQGVSWDANIRLWRRQGTLPPGVATTPMLEVREVEINLRRSVDRASLGRQCSCVSTTHIANATHYTTHARSAIFGEKQNWYSKTRCANALVLFAHVCEMLSILEC